MSSETARKIVVASAFLGIAAVIYEGQKAGTPTATIYRRSWGLLLLVIGGSVLADFAPQVVGPYMLLVLLGFLITNKGLGNLFTEAGNAANTNSKGA